MSKYSWSQYNFNNIKLANKIYDFNKKQKISYYENGPYNHVRDIFALSILMLRKKRLIKVLDYGSNVASTANFSEKIKLKNFKFFIYDPFSKKKFLNMKKFNTIIYNKSLLSYKFDLIHFGSSIQYMENLETINKVINLEKPQIISITNTPISLKENYKCTQSNHKNLKQNIHHLEKIKKFLKKKGFNIIFISRNDDKYVACLKNKKKTYSLNMIFSKD